MEKKNLPLRKRPERRKDHVQNPVLRQWLPSGSTKYGSVVTQLKGRLRLITFGIKKSQFLPDGFELVNEVKTAFGIRAINRLSLVEQNGRFYVKVVPHIKPRQAGYDRERLRLGPVFIEIQDQTITGKLRELLGQAIAGKRTIEYSEKY